MKRKRLILTILSLVVILSLSSLVLWRYLSGKYVETAESIRDYFMWPTYQRLPLEYYNSFGYYPRSMDEAVDFYQQTYWPNMAKKDLRAQQFLTDPFARDGGEFLKKILFTIIISWSRNNNIVCVFVCQFCI